MTSPGLLTDPVKERIRMESNHNEAAVRTDSSNAQAGTTSAGEIDLYDELIAFAELSPEEQLRLAAPPEEMSAETGKAATESAEEPAPEPVLVNGPLETVEAETAAGNGTPSAEQAEDTSPEPAQTHLPIEPVESDLTVPAAESARDSEVSNADVEPGEVRPELLDGSRPSGPLSGFSLTPDFVFTGALSRGVCLACGAESGTDDLFCMTCGVFIDEVASTLPFNPTCEECRHEIAPDEIFCPWCGSVLPA